MHDECSSIHCASAIERAKAQQPRLVSWRLLGLCISVSPRLLPHFHHLITTCVAPLPHSANQHHGTADAFSAITETATPALCEYVHTLPDVGKVVSIGIVAKRVLVFKAPWMHRFTRSVERGRSIWRSPAPVLFGFPLHSRRVRFFGNGSRARRMQSQIGRASLQKSKCPRAIQLSAHHFG
jgi:hypothetical protein